MPITSLKQLKENFDDGRGKTAIRPILNYYPNGIQSAYIDIDHDGCDSFGWESDLVTITIKAKSMDRCVAMSGIMGIGSGKVANG